MPNDKEKKEDTKKVDADLLEEYIQKGYIIQEFKIGKLAITQRTLLTDEHQEINEVASEWIGKSEIFFKTAYTKELLAHSIVNWNGQVLPIPQSNETEQQTTKRKAAIDVTRKLLGSKGAGLVQKLSDTYNDLEAKVNKLLKIEGEDLKNSLTTPSIG